MCCVPMHQDFKADVGLAGPHPQTARQEFSDREKPKACVSEGAKQLHDSRRKSAEYSDWLLEGKSGMQPMSQLAQMLTVRATHVAALHTWTSRSA